MIKLQEEMYYDIFKESNEVNSKLRQAMESTDINKADFGYLMRADSFYEQSRKLESIKHNILAASHFGREEIAKVLCYLVSQIEDAEYKYQIADIGSETGFNYFGKKATGERYKLLYLCRRYNENSAEKDIEKNFKNVSNETVLFNSLCKTGSKYIQLGYFHPYQYNFFDFEEREVSNDGDFQEFLNKIMIWDAGFLYIRDFMVYMIEYRLNKQDGNFGITMDEMMKLADDFAFEYKISLETGARH